MLALHINTKLIVRIFDPHPDKPNRVPRCVGWVGRFVSHDLNSDELPSG
jgi:hypothetical protein